MKKICLLLLLLCFAHPLLADISDKEYQQIGETFTLALNEGDIETLIALFDMDRFARISMSLITDNLIERQDLIKGMKQVKEKDLLTNWFSSFYSTAYRQADYLRTLNYKGIRGPLVRLDMGDEGLEYLILFLEKDEDELRIVDFYTASSGKKNSVALANATQLLMPSNNNPLLRLLGKREANTDLISKMRQIGTLYRSGEFQKTYNLIEKLPEDIRTSRTILDISIQASMQINDELYLNELGLLEKHYGKEDNTVFMLVDYHFMKEDYGEVMNSINRMLKLYGKDAALLNLKANGAFMAGNLKQAAKLSREAIELEDDYEDAWWTLVTVYVSDEKFGEAVLAFKELSQNFGYEFDRATFENEEFYQGFVKSSAFDTWLPKPGS